MQAWLATHLPDDPVRSCHPGCSTTRDFIPTPNLFAAEESFTTEHAPEDQGRQQLEILYVTDRTTTNTESRVINESVTGQHTIYGSARSARAVFGAATVDLQQDIDWATLLDASDGAKRNTRLTFGGVQAVEVGQYPETPYLFNLDPSGKPSIDVKTLQDLDVAKRQFRKLVVKRLEQSPTNDVVIYIHGFNNTFEYAAQTLSGIWHFLQRRQVPILYSWPAGKGGFRGYFIDGESGQYTVFHLKELLRTLFETPEINKIHIIAHSRRTEVITTAMRELLIEHRQSKDLRQYFKIANLILAAPDLDFGIVRQRLMAEQFGAGFDQITVYSTNSDKALNLSQFILRGIRFGLLATEDLGKRDRSILENVGNVGFILATNVKSFAGYDYFFSNPAVSSDLLTVINHSVKPGSTLRPLTHQGGNFWLLDAKYPEFQ